MFWNQQNICSTSEFKPEILNTDKLDLKEWRLPEGYNWIDLTKLSISRIIKFIEKSNAFETSVTSIPTKFLNHSLNIGYSIGVINQKRKLVGMALVLVFKSRLNNTGYNIMHTCYLCVHPKYRRIGLAPAIIRELMRRTSLNNLYIGYHLSAKPIGNNSIPVRGWIKTQESLDEKIPMTLSLASSLTYELTKIDWKNISHQLQNYQVKFTLTQLKHFYSQPNYKIIKTRNNNYAGYRVWPIIDRSLKQKFEIICLDFYLGDPLILKEICQTWLNRYPIIYMFELGTLNETLLTQISSQPVDLKYINWYNWAGKYSASDVWLPLV